jgi:type III secretory pathway lipoprotein EscJ
VFLTMPASDSERLSTVAHLGANGVTCYLRSRQVDADSEGMQSGIAMTILVPEAQLQRAQQVLAAMLAEGDPP